MAVIAGSIARYILGGITISTSYVYRLLRDTGRDRAILADVAITVRSYRVPQPTRGRPGISADTAKLKWVDLDSLKQIFNYNHVFLQIINARTQNVQSNDNVSWIDFQSACCIQKTIMGYSLREDS